MTEELKEGGREGEHGIQVTIKAECVIRLFSSDCCMDQIKHEENTGRYPFGVYERLQAKTACN